ncbi:MAG: hypothetical protein HC933_00820 [Pleurocapsa sp. SU_196_0]|nr:hypothetical protein [Pleurocapsa sp. SU_196_0]
MKRWLGNLERLLDNSLTLPQMELTWIKGRSFQRGKNEIHLNYLHPAKACVAEHETAHALEANHADLLKAAVQFRTTRTASERPVGLATLFPRHGYRSTETTLRDGFMHAYTGKLYRNASGTDYATEVTSMGIQHLLEDTGKFFHEDIEHFFFTLGQLAGARIHL